MKFKIIIFLLMIGFSQGCRNLYRDFGDKTSDDYLITQARFDLDALDFDAAISRISPVLVSQPTNAEVVYLAAAAHAGKAGLRVMDLFLQFSSISSNGLIPTLADHFGATTDDDVAQIEEAISIIETYDADPTTRGAHLNFFSVFLYFSRIGAISARYAYDTSGVLDATFDNCRNTDEGGYLGIPDASIDSLIDAFVKLGPAIANSGSSAFSSVGSAIDALGISAPGTSCDTSKNGAMCLIVRDMLGAGPLGTPPGIGFNISAVPPKPADDINVCVTVLP